MKQCSVCGNSFADGADYCTVCGSSLGAPVAPPPSGFTSVPTVSAGKNTAIVVCLITCIVVLFAALAIVFVPKLISHQAEEHVTADAEPAEELSWNLDEASGTLTVGGCTEIPHYDSAANMAPWYAKKDLIRNVVVEKGVTAIGDHAFEGLYALADVSLPDTLVEIGEQGFAGCSSLSSVYIPLGVSKIGDGAFHGCNSLVRFDVDGRNNAFCSADGVLMSKDRTVLVQFPANSYLTEYSIPYPVTQIEAGAFYSCLRLTRITIPTGVSELKELTFYNCTSLSQIVLPMTVRTIRPSAFTDLIYLSDGTTQVGCTGMKKIYYDGLEEWFYSIDFGEDNKNLFRAMLIFVDPWDMPQSTADYFETYLR